MVRKTSPCIPLEIIYRCGVFGLPIGTEPVKPENLHLMSDKGSLVLRIQARLHQLIHILLRKTLHTLVRPK